MNRRDFIQSSAMTLAGLSLGIPSFSNDEPVRIALVGSGGRGTDLLRKLSTIERCEVVAVCDDYPPHLQRGLKTAGPQAKGFVSFSKMLKEIKPEAVVIATPLFLHYPMSIEALEAGCAVFCEKTMCHSVEEARKLAEKIKAEEHIFQVGLQRRANAIYLQAKAMVDAGMLGRITTIKAQWHRNNDWRRPVPVPKAHADWQKLEHKLNWRLYWPYSQGLMAELGSHQIDVANWFLNCAPQRVMGTGGIDYWRDGREVYDNVLCVYDYEIPAKDGEDAYSVRMTYTSIQSNAFEGASELIMGTKGSLYLTQKKGLFYQEKVAEDQVWQDKKAADVITSGKTLKMSNDPWAHRAKPFEMDIQGDDSREQLISFLDNVQRKDPETICTAEDGYLDAKAAISGNLSIGKGKIIEL